jgi:hypothetical protein
MTTKIWRKEQTLAVQVIPPPRASKRDICALETVAQSLALDSRHPVALEIARTPQGRQFLLRATLPVALNHLVDQIQARYPQATIVPLSSDPLTLASDETVSAVELCPGAASYLPLRTWRDRELQGEGTDPILGLLAALSHTPKNVRAVAQLAILPMKPTWSQSHWRLTVEHPLEPERQRRSQRQRHSSSAGPSTGAIVGMGVLVAFLLAGMRLKSTVPMWMIHAVVQLLHGNTPNLTTTQLTMVISGAIIFLVLLVLLKFLVTRRKTAIYDRRMVAEKTGKSAYQARLRLFVIRSHPSDTQTQTLPVVSFRRPIRFPILSAFSSVRLIVFAQAWKRWRDHQTQQSYKAQECQDVLDQLTAAYRQYHTAAGGYFVPRTLSESFARRLLVRKDGWFGRLFTGWECDLSRSHHILSVADVGMLFHLPQSTDLLDLPLVERGRAHTFLAPEPLTTGNGWKMGVSTHAGHVVPVFLPRVELRRNFLALASTGKGKSTLFQHVAQALLSPPAPNDTLERPVEMDGLLVLEPHREMIDALLGLMPACRRENVILVDLANRDYPVGLNPIDATLGRDRDKTIDNLLVIFEHIWANSWGPRTENVMEYGLKTLADANDTMVREDPQNGPDAQYTLLDVIALLRHQSFRHTVMDQVRDPALKNWWEHYYEPMDLRFQLEVISSVVNKLSKFASSRVSRRILGQPRSTLNLSQIIQQGQILLISTAAGIVGSDISTLIGSFLLGLFHMTLAEQIETHRAQRRHFLALIDEFQVYQGVDWNSMLAELRKVGGSFGLATQSLAYLDKMDKTLRATVMANIDHLFAFAMAAEDARLLRELEGVEVEDITNLDNYMCYVRASLGTKRLPVFSLTIDPPAPGDEKAAQWIRRRSQQRDARPAAVVDEMLASSSARVSSPNLTQRGKHGPKMGGLLPVPTGQTPEEQQADTSTRRKRHPSKAKTTPAREQAVVQTAQERQEPSQEQGWSRPLLYEGVGPSEWGREEQEHGT